MDVLYVLHLSWNITWINIRPYIISFQFCFLWILCISLYTTAMVLVDYNDKCIDFLDMSDISVTFCQYNKAN